MGHGRRDFGLARRPRTFGKGEKVPLPPPAGRTAEGHPPRDAEIALGCSHSMGAAERSGTKGGSVTHRKLISTSLHIEGLQSGAPGSSAAIAAVTAGAEACHAVGHAAREESGDIAADRPSELAAQRARARRAELYE